MKKLLYIKTTDGEIFRPQASGVKDPNTNFSNYPVCIIKKLLFGRYKIEYYDRLLWLELGTLYSYSPGDEDKPNAVKILYPSGIKEIKYEH